MDAQEKIKVEYPKEWHILCAANELCKTSSFKDIQVQEICKAAAISKPTFYRLFKSKADIFAWHIEKASEAGICQIGRAYTFYKGLLKTEKCLAELKELHLSFVGYDMDMPFDGLGHANKIAYRAFVETLAQEKRLRLTDDLDFQVKASIALMGSAISQFKQDGMTRPERFAALCESCIPVQLRYSLVGTDETVIDFVLKDARVRKAKLNDPHNEEGR